MEEYVLKKLWINVSLIVIIPGLFFITACANKTVHTEQMAEDTAPAMEQKTTEQEQASVTENQSEEDINRAQQAEQAAREEDGQKAKMASEVLVNKDIYFDFDSTVLKDTSKESLIKKAEWLRMHPGASVVIEGHCDERGTSAYNIALGDRRAQSAKAFFVDLGIDADMLSTVSYGEERPADLAQTEAAWAMNRRAHFVID